MENKKLHIPTLEELKTICKDEKYNNIPSDRLLIEVIRLLKNNSKFHEYLEDTYFDYYELPYILFWDIINYIKFCYDKKDEKNIKKILKYLDNMLKSKDDSILDLVCIWSLESFHIHKEILPEMVKLMPNELKKAFLTDFWDYLD